jgi:hypothetical protein
MEVGVASCKGRHAGAGARDEVVVDDVGVALAGAVAGDVAATAAPVVNDLSLGVSHSSSVTKFCERERCATDIVLKVIDALDLGVAGLVVNVQVAEEADAAVRLHEPAARVRLEPLGDDAVLDGDVLGCAADGEGLVATPGHADVVKDHAGALGDGDGVLARRAALAHADADVAHDGVVGVGPAPAVAIDGNALGSRRVRRAAAAAALFCAMRGIGKGLTPPGAVWPAM